MSSTKFVIGDIVRRTKPHAVYPVQFPAGFLAEVTSLHAFDEKIVVLGSFTDFKHSTTCLELVRPALPEPGQTKVLDGVEYSVVCAWYTPQGVSWGCVQLAAVNDRRIISLAEWRGLGTPSINAVRDTVVATTKAAREAAKAAKKAAAEKAKSEQAAANEEAEREARKLAHDAELEQVINLVSLAGATKALLLEVDRSLRSPGTPPSQLQALSKFYTELRPLARSLVYDIVLAGNKSFGALVTR